MQKPKVYVVIPVHNRRAYTEACLECLSRQTYEPLQVVLVDDGSTDGTSQMVEEKYPSVHLIHGDGNLWWVGGINAGLEWILTKAGTGDLVLLMNNDLTFGPELVETLIRAHQRRPQAVIGSIESRADQPDIIVNGGTWINWWLATGTDINAGRHVSEFSPDHLEPVSWVTGRGVLFPVRVFRDLGLYDKRFVQVGDPEMGLRAKKNGYELLACYGAVVYHFPDDNKGINSGSYRWRDLRRYFFDERSHTNLKNIFWNAVLCTKNPLQGISYFMFNLLRISFHFVRHVERK